MATGGWSEAERAARMRLADAYEAAFDAALGDDYGNFMEARMVTEEMAYGGDDRAIDALMAMDARLADAKAAGEAARAAAAKAVR